MIKILADENIPYGIDAFSTLGTVQLVAGRAISQEMLKDKDALIVRSITKVNKELLSGTAVRFVGTCTIGEDHVDKQYLEEQDDWMPIQSSGQPASAMIIAERASLWDQR